MNEKELESKLSEYFERVNNPNYTTGDWIITSDDIYKKLKGKFKILNIISINNTLNESVVVAESKNKYYAIKYNNNFICIRESDTEYGLAIDGYDLFAVNKRNLYKLAPKSKTITFKEISKTFNWKLTTKARDILDYFA